MKEKYKEKELFRLSEENQFASLIFLCKKVERICIKGEKQRKKRKDHFGHHTLCSIDVQLAGCPYAIPVIFVSQCKFLLFAHVLSIFYQSSSWPSENGYFAKNPLPLNRKMSREKFNFECKQRREAFGSSSTSVIIERNNSHLNQKQRFKGYTILTA